MGRAKSNFLGPAPWGPGEGSKVQISFNFNYKVNFKDLYQIVGVFSQMKDTTHIRWEFYSVAWVMPKGWDFGALGVPRRSNIFFPTWSCSISNRRDDEQNKIQVTFSS